MNRKKIAILVLGIILFACLLACGYFGVKTIRRVRLRRGAMEAYEKKDYILAERLLRVYVRQDPNAEAEFVALANIYHEFGNTGLEAQMWQTASSLNPLNSEYYEKMLTTAMKSASYALLHGILARKARVGEKLTDRELYLYVISSYRVGDQKDGGDAYQKAVKADPEVFHKNELGLFAEFMANYSKLSANERENYLSQAMQSEDSVVRFEAVYSFILAMAQQNGGEVDSSREEELLKQAVEANYFAGTPLLADYYFSKFRFGDVLAVLEPYLKTIDNIKLYLLYAESCVFEGKLDELKALENRLRRKPAPYPLMADYCTILIAHMENDEEKLTSAVRQSGKIISTPLSRFIRLRVAIASWSLNEIQTLAQAIFSEEPFQDLHNLALLACMEYVSGEMKKQENQDDPSRIAGLAKILAGYLHNNQMLTEIILMDQYNKELVKEADLLTAVNDFPESPLLRQIAVEFLIFNGKPEQALTILEPILADPERDKQEESQRTRFLYMLTLDQLGRRDEAAALFQKLVEQFEFDLDLLRQYFQFCEKNKRKDDLASMADKLETVKDGKLERFGRFFRAAAMLATEDESNEKEALDILASAPADDPEFTFYAANRLYEHKRFDEAEAKYNAIRKTYSIPFLVRVNLSELYRDKGDTANALEAAKEAFDMEKSSMLPAFIYAKRLSEAERYEDAVRTLNFPRRAVNCPEDAIELWTDCMHHVIENSIAGERYMQAEEQLKHLLIIAPDDEFGQENLAKVREILKTQKEEGKAENAAAPAA